MVQQRHPVPHIEIAAVAVCVIEHLLTWSTGVINKIIMSKSHGLVDKNIYLCF